MAKGKGKGMAKVPAHVKASTMKHHSAVKGFQPKAGKGGFVHGPGPDARMHK